MDAAKGPPPAQPDFPAGSNNQTSQPRNPADGAVEGPSPLASPPGTGEPAGPSVYYPVVYPPTFAAHIKQDFRSLSRKFTSRKDRQPANKAEATPTGTSGYTLEAAANATQAATPHGLQMIPVTNEAPVV
ncbi:hypothetical protein WJX72_011877 [[Myrmecia] bisecta]|uniref:Uncharacterized protein n=1 Tax=[Myrmecia] bisecta TaxID=41462 RepID=A0AAW1Q6G0_9CHLO